MESEWEGGQCWSVAPSLFQPLISKVLWMLRTHQSLIPHALASNLLFPLRTLLFFLQDLVPALAGSSVVGASAHGMKDHRLFTVKDRFNLWCVREAIN